MLTCDAFGVLPAVSKLSAEEAVDQFLLGYTAKVAGTEGGVLEPQATFSPCFGLPFMPLPPIEYAKLLKSMITEHDVDCWLVNTGWTSGAYGTGQRMKLEITRKIISGILSGKMTKCDTIFHEKTGMTIPLYSKVSSEYLIPEMSWNNKQAYLDTLAILNKLKNDYLVQS